ncbi:DUF6428 family protein [Parapedobacter sp. DT-150]|uniref:DUF6428 family protein n=1 Tax=Parapedobacter sp. DT-150 TaxID=3396162 RepID=UPI003F1CBF83
MNNADLMTWAAFKDQLAAHPDAVLQFQYAEGKWVDAAYHITEIKQAPITSVDCGGVMNAWTEIIVQLWEPEAADKERAMAVSKALSIADVVEKTLPLNPSGIVKIEFGNSQFDTRQMYPGEFIEAGENLVVNLIPDATQCKAIGRGDNCTTTIGGDPCCGATEGAATKKKVELVQLTTADVCTPGSGCC